MISLKGPALDAEERAWLASPAVGGVILFARNYVDRKQLTELVATIHAVRRPPLLVAVDHEGGRVQRFQDEFFRLPPPSSLGHLYDEDPESALKAAAAFGWVTGAELRAVGIDLGFAPVVDRDLGLADVIGDRALHRDAEVVAALALRFAAGAKHAGMQVTAKHFPTHAGALSDSHTEPAVDRRELAALDDDLLPYRKLISWGLHSVMVAHVSFPAVDPKPASVSAWWIKEMLRGRLGFSGAVIADDMNMAGAAVAGSATERVRSSLDAGCDLVLLCNAPADVPAVIEALEGYVNPSAQLRLTRLHGGTGGDWEALHASAEWQRACEALGQLRARPELRLEG